jgi:hypothetical protein
MIYQVQLSLSNENCGQAFSLHMEVTVHTKRVKLNPESRRIFRLDISVYSPTYMLFFEKQIYCTVKL